MKKLFSIFLVLCFLSVFAQESIDFQNLKFSELLTKAKKENKLIFLDAYASWCGPCKLLEKNIFPQKAVKEFYNANFINTHIDMEKGEGPQIAQKYMIRSYPSLLFINGDGEIIQQTMGYMDADSFIDFGKKANNPVNKLGSPKQVFEKGESSPEFLVNIINTNANSDYDFAKKAAERYFQTKKTPDFTKDEVSYILYFTKSVKDPLYQVFLNHQTEILKYYSQDVYNQFNNQIKLSEILEHSLDAAKGVINDDYFYKNAIPLVGKEEASKTLNRLKINFYPQTGNFAEYEKAALEYYKNPDDFTGEELDRAAYIFSQNIKNPTSLKKAQEWAEKSVMKTETPENTYILAKIYQKLGNTAQAKMYAELSQNLANAQGKDAKLAQDLLTELK